MYTLTDRLKNTRLGLERRVINNAADEQRRGVAWRGAAWRVSMQKVIVTDTTHLETCRLLRLLYWTVDTAECFLC